MVVKVQLRRDGVDRGCQKGVRAQLCMCDVRSAKQPDFASESGCKSESGMSWLAGLCVSEAGS